MFVILGASGHVGSAVAKTLIEAGEPVTAVLHGAEHEPEWQAQGARTAVVDVRDSEALRAIFRTGKRAFLLNPPADVATDTDREEHATARSIVAALENSGLEKVVLESTYGARPGERCGDLNVLYDFEQALGAQPIPFTVQRAAYYMSNWDELLPAAKEGKLPTMLPHDLELPMVAPVDLGRAAAGWLREPPKHADLHYVEGPRRYSADDVAKAFAEALGRPVEVSVIPRDRWIESYRQLGFSNAAAESYARMTAVSVDAGFDMTERHIRRSTTLEDYIDGLVARARVSPIG